MRYLVLAMLALFMASGAQAQAFKCKTADGKTVFSDTGCFGNSRTEKARNNEYVSSEQQQQAMEVHAKRLQEIDRLNEDNQRARVARAQGGAIDSGRPSSGQPGSNGPSQVDSVGLSVDHVGNCIKDVERQAMAQNKKAELITACRTAAVSQRAAGISGDAVSNCVKNVERTGAAGNEKARQIALCHGGDVPVEITVNQQKQAPAPSTITSCDKGGCWDNNGTRYNSAGGGAMYRADGKYCRQIGNMLQCD